MRERPICVIGAGTLGRQIAALFFARGATVRLVDVDPTTLDRAVDEAVALVPDIGETPDIGAGLLNGTTNLETALEGVWLAIECVPERIDLKTRVFRELDRMAPADAILATNSSSIRSSLLIGEVSRPERVLNLHFYNIPWKSPGVEIMSCGKTDAAAIGLLARALPEYGLEPFVAKTESSGFIYNRIWAAIKREALQVVAEGVATPEEVDRLFCLVNGATLGPFQRMDLVGLDVVLDIEERYASERENIPEAPRQLLRSMVEAGKLGAKTGEGFYRHE